MEYQEALEYLFNQLPMYQRQGPAAYKIDLSNTHKILDILGHPEKGLKYVHVAGTNGKGSVSHMMASVLQVAGYKTGLCTSPHLKDYRERIRINGEKIPIDIVTEFVSQYKEQFLSVDASFFEITIGMAFWYFLKEKVDVVVLETGLGGRLDSTNVITPEISVITNIGMDHMQFLGDTIEKIAFEKGGIIKKGVPVVLGEMRETAEEVLVKIAKERGCDVRFAKTLDGKLPESDLIGAYQVQNAKTAITGLKSLRSLGWKISTDDLLNGLSNVQSNTGLQARWQILNHEPLVVADGAHNSDGLKFVLNHAVSITKGSLHIVIGVVADKNLEDVLPLFPKDATYYFASPDVPRAMPVDSLVSSFEKAGLRGEQFKSIKSAYQASRLYAEKEDTIIITGSMFTVAEVI